MTKNPFVKFFIVLMVCLVVVQPLFFASRAQAQIPVTDMLAFAEKIDEWIKTVGKWLKDEQLKIIRDQVVKVLIDKITNDVVQKIQGGGNPLYVTDWKQYVQYAGDITFNNFNNYLTQNGGPNLCAPFAPQIQMLFSYQYSSTGFYGLPLQCRFEDFKNNIQFTKTYIERGGWVTFDQMFLPENNPLGYALVLGDTYQAQVAAEKEARLQEANTGQGFLGIKKCVELPADISAGLDDACGDDQACRSYVEQQHCTKWETQTPGNAVANALTASIDKDFEYLENVQTIVATIVNVAVSKILSGATGGLSGFSSGGSGGSFQDQGGADFQQGQYQSQLRDIRQGYEDFISYVNEILLPSVNSASSLIEPFNTQCASSAITYIDASGNENTVAISDLYQLIALAKLTMNRGLLEAQGALRDIDGVDLTDPNIVSIVSRITSSYTEFATSQYEPMFVEAQASLRGVPGTLDSTFRNIVTALSGFSCGL